MIGPLRSLAWLAGLDELIKAIDHPAYVIQDDIEVISFGTSLLWPLDRWVEEGTVPPTIWAKDSWNNPPAKSSSLATTVPNAVPAAVKGTVETHSFQGNKKSYKLVGRPDYSVWYGDYEDTTLNVFVVEAKRRYFAADGLVQCLAYMGGCLYPASRIKAPD